MPAVSNQQALVAIELSEQSRAKFNASLNRYLSSVKMNRKKAITKLAGGILTDISKLSPVDTGRFRAAWHAGYRALGQRPPAIRASDPLKKPPSAVQIALGEAQGYGKLNDTPELTEFTCRNGVRYGPYLEAGGSNQAPRGMVRVTIDRYRQFIDDSLSNMPVEGTK